MGFTNSFNKPAIYFGFIKEFDVGKMYLSLSVKEKEKVSRLLKIDDRDLFIVSRCILKSIISKYINTRKNEVEISYTSFGKPYIEGASNLHFSVAHTKEIFVIAVSREYATGIDVEHIEREINYEKLSSLLFTPKELELFSKSIPKQQIFINSWTRKEAFCKAKGIGLSFPLDQLEISSLEGGKLEMLAAKWDKEENENWFIKNFDLPNNYRGAIAVNGPVNGFELIHVLKENINLESQDKLKTNNLLKHALHN
ncbi:MAG: 4'-phosphopantetheinyl transferase superfamily protein [Bacteroidetes bacterium]|nr:4'-phosphopantetheinyl transferase superfamily protein [Bacteroidota bacterium]